RGGTELLRGARGSGRRCARSRGQAESLCELLHERNRERDGAERDERVWRQRVELSRRRALAIDVRPRGRGMVGHAERLELKRRVLGGDVRVVDDDVALRRLAPERDL